MSIAAGDWRDADSYDRLLPGDRRCFAWEWLRRTPAYVDAWIAGGSPAPFGLVRLEDPVRDAFAARPIWSAAVDRAVLRGTGLHAANGDRMQLASLMALVAVAPFGATNAILLSDGLRSIRIDVDAALPVTAPMAMTWHIAGMADVGSQLTALAQLSSICRSGHFARTLHPPERRAKRWVAMLRVHDALSTEASTRAIVAELFNVSTSQPKWRVSAPSWRLRVQRLAARASRALTVGPGAWLDPSTRV